MRFYFQYRNSLACSKAGVIQTSNGRALFHLHKTEIWKTLRFKIHNSQNEIQRSHSWISENKSKKNHKNLGSPDVCGRAKAAWATGIRGIKKEGSFARKRAIMEIIYDNPPKV